MIYQKEFDKWNEKKKIIDTSSDRPNPRIGEIWICDFGLNIGFEIDGKDDYKRPALIISSFLKNGAIVIPLTSKDKKNKYSFSIDENSFLNLTQIRFVDSKRLNRKIDKIDENSLIKIKEAICLIINRNPHL